MKHRLDLLEGHVKPTNAGGNKPKPPAMKPVVDVWQSLGLDNFLSDEVKVKKQQLAEKLKKIEPQL
jgi:hypothetical protein